MAASTGRILLISKGDYIDSTEYNILDIVRDGGKTWLCRQTCTGQTPSSNEYWFLLCQDGESGTIGSIWYRGTGITGTSETPTIFSGSGVALANVSDMYLNSTTGNVYQCTTGGNAATAEWVFVISLGGTASWEGIADKPFNTIGSNGLIVATDVLDVDLLKIERKASTLTSKATVALADEMVITDSEDTSITKRSPLSALKTLLDTFYNYVLPTASTTTLGGVKVGTGLEMDGETLNATGGGGGTVINDPTTAPATPLETTNVLDDITSIMNNSTANQVAGALALKGVNSNLEHIINALDSVPLIPIATANTSNMECNATMYSTEHKLYYAFDASDTTSVFWSNQANKYIGYIFDFPKYVEKIKIRCHTGSPGTPTGVATISISTDGTTYEDISTMSYTGGDGEYEVPISETIKSFRISPNTSLFLVAKLQAYAF